MKHLIETENPSGLPITEYDRIILNSATDEIVYRGGVDNANILMFSLSGYQLYSDMTFKYAGTEKYDNKEYFKYSLADGMYILAPTRNITKVTFPFDGYYIGEESFIVPLLEIGFRFDRLYGFTSVPENKVLMKPRTDIGTNVNNKTYVDLGLTSGTLWATMNVGATSETDYGDYFMWGSTTPNTDTTCNWANAPFNNGSSSYDSAYFDSVKDAVCPNGILAKEYDAARANMGGDWRMPTVALIEELVEETTSEWVEDFNGSGVNGRKFTSKTDESKYIFFPVSGYRLDSSSSLQSPYGYVWSSSPYTMASNFAWKLDFGSSYCTISEDNLGRNVGLPVRGVL